MNAAIFAGTFDGYVHGRDHVLHYYKWHKQICDVKILSRTDKEYGIPDIRIIQCDSQYMWSYGLKEVLKYSLEFNYDYYFFIGGDVYILDKFLIDLSIADMEKDKLDAIFGIIETRIEHKKYTFYKQTSELFNIPMNRIVWSANNFFVVRKKCIEFYLSNNRHTDIWPEVGLINCLKSKFNVVQSKHIQKNVFGQGVAHLTYYREYINAGIPVFAMHAIKDYKILELAGLTNPENCGAK